LRYDWFTDKYNFGVSFASWFAADWTNDFGANLFTIEARSQDEVAPGQTSIWPNGIRKWRVASTDYSDYDHATAIANASLISAAPDLADALEKLITIDANLTGQQRQDAMEDLIIVARAALAKARGTPSS